ncbi:TniQ family protein [Metabacillus litoralis]|uniref:TniQ family protein n=1 Tax=Metabacillus litoralis TaxID=152268 RepID=UPI0013CF2891|nr:TniQ family protein [Metabacillus litoralis]
MGEDKKTDLEILGRSRLYNLPPIGIDSVNIESLRSYIGRIAQAHSWKTSDFINDILITEIKNIHYKDNPEIFYGRAGSINGFGDFTEECIKSLESLTMCNNLSYLTLKKCKDIFHHPNIFHRYLRWCSSCLEEFRERKIEIYEPLLWSISIVEYCPNHRKPLNSICPGCGKRPVSFSRKYSPGYCTRCEQWLGSDSEDDKKLCVTEMDSEWKLFVAEQMGELMKLNSSDKLPLEKNGLFNLIHLIIKITSGGNVSRFASLINRDRKRVTEWKLRRGLPNVESLIAICRLLEINLQELLLGNVNKTTLNKEYNHLLNLNIPPGQVQKKRSDQVNDSLEIELEKIYLNEYPPPSLAELQRRFNYYNMERRFPELSKKIAAKNTKYRREQQKLREELICKEVREIIMHLHNLGEVISENNIKRRMDNPGNFRNPLVRATWKKMKQLLEENLI